TVDSNAPYGQFFIDPNVSLVGNVFIVDGDRYGDMRPSVFEGVFQNNRIYVTITEGVGEPYGGLFELRGKDGFVTTSCQPDEFFCQAIDPNTPIPDCNVDTWTVEGMELIKGAKLTLTNRFAFQPPFDPGTDDDVFYVKELILREDSVFNTSFNRVYCGSLTVEPNASIVNVPLLGFSLIRIALDDDTEFIHRVTHNNLEHPEDPNYNRTHAARIEGSPPDPNGMMELRNTADLDPNSPTCGQMINARAKGLFAKASEDQVLIMFEYLFVEDPCEDAELIVYLSDRPQVDQNLVEMARVQPPEPNRPGSIGSDTFALFSGIFPRGSLEFTRGTYVGLELCGTGTRCWIDDWDPQVNCTAICGDFYLDMFNIVNVYDYLVLLAEFGLLGPATAGKGCLDLVTDGCVNNEDLIAWGVDEVLNKCPSGEGASVWDEPATTEPLVSALQLEAQTAAQSGAFLVFGKPPTGIGADVPESYLYSIDDAGTCTGDAIEPACPAASCEDADGRFVTDGSGNIYQVNGNLGLVRQDTQDVVVEPNILDFETSRVSVGFNEGTGLLLLDAAFSPADANIVYVLPVLVDPQDGNCPYMAAAKLQLTGQGNYNLLKLYGRNPATDPCQKNTLTDCDGELMYEPDVQHLHEIEIDADGNNVFVLSAYWFNDNYWVLIYDEEVGNDSEIRVSLSDANIVGPTALLVSSFDDKAYVASSVTTSDDLTTEVYRFSVNKTGHVATGLTYDGCLDINCPEPNICQTTPAVCDDTLGFTSAITSMAENPRDGTLYVTGFTAPKFAEAEALPSQIDGIFTTPILAVLPFDVNEPVEAAQIANCDPSFPLVLPLSIVRTGPVICSTADVTGDLIVDMDDFAILALHWLDSNCIQAGWCDGADMNRSNAVDWTDVAVLTHYWLQTPCSD
ncbi:MAG: hypothetical protein ACYS76_06695, partial [Planctomycetota bacterium]